jgi:hypothetical protein
VDKVDGKVHTNGKEYRVLNGVVRGTTVSFELTSDGGRFEGSINGTTMSGKWARGGSSMSATGKRISEGTVASTQWTNP